MDVKLGTQTWSKNPQPGIRHSENVHTNSAVDENKMYSNGDDLGDTLNRVADPNWVDPAKKPRAVGSSELGKDAFMSLLLTQMKNQDPTNPLKSHEMAAQLAQFTSLEKLTNIDQGIEKLRTDAKPDKNFEALALIGKTVVTDSSKISRFDQKSSHDLRFKLAADAQKATISIKDAKGNVVRNLTFPNLKEGKNNLTWNGQMEDGSMAPAGEYTMEVDARSSNGSRIYAQSKAQGAITGINFTGHGPQVMIGKDAIDMADIKSISDPTAEENQSAPAPGIPIPGMAPGGAGPAAMAMPPGMRLPPGMQMPAGGPGAGPMVPGMAALGLPKSALASALPSAEEISPLPAAMAAKRTINLKPESKGDGARRARLANGSVTDAKMPGSLFKQLQKQGVGEG